MNKNLKRSQIYVEYMMYVNFMLLFSDNKFPELVYIVGGALSLMGGMMVNQWTLKDDSKDNTRQ